MDLRADPVEIDQLKEAERTWHDAVYHAHAQSAYPASSAEFEFRFIRHHLAPPCDGGWSWWADARCKAVAAMGEVHRPRVLDYGCGFGSLGLFPGLRGAEVWGFELSLPAIEVANQSAAQYEV
jgi:2-polyprenyl-3-methyl-5-hydroxy-6-metoxy-1,4-benzoquinol methylase